MDKLPSHYECLQVAENASAEVIRGAYRCLSQRWHPDKNPERRAEAEGMIRLINKAYTVLSNPALRREHDASLAEHRAAYAPSRARPAEPRQPSGEQPRPSHFHRRRRRRGGRRVETRVLPRAAWGIAAGLVAFAISLVALAEPPSIELNGHDVTVGLFVLVGGLLGAWGRLASHCAPTRGSTRYAP